MCDCFKCKIKTIGFSVGSVRGVVQGKPGRDAFHGATIPERRAQMLTEARDKQVVPQEMTRRETETYRSGDRF